MWIGSHMQTVRPPTLKQRSLRYIWVSKGFCHRYTFPNPGYDKPSPWPPFLASRESHSNSGGVTKMQQLCYTTPKCLGALLKLIKSLACLLREIEPILGVINHGPSPDITAGQAPRVPRPEPQVPLCPTHNSVILEGFIPERYEEIPPDLFGAWEERPTFPVPLGLQYNCVSGTCIFQPCKCAGLGQGCKGAVIALWKDKGGSGALHRSSSLEGPFQRGCLEYSLEILQERFCSLRCLVMLFC